MGCNGLIPLLFLFDSLICYNIKYVKRINGTAQRRCHATTRMGNFFFQESKAKEPKEARILRLLTFGQNIFFVTKLVQNSKIQTGSK